MMVISDKYYGIRYCVPSKNTVVLAPLEFLNWYNEQKDHGTSL